MGSVDRVLVQKLQEAGNKLARLPTEVDVLLPLLDDVESLLSRVEQSPPPIIQNAYAAAMKALLEEPLLRHSDVDVKVAIASCISEITRITAPEAPYDDDQMKDVFQLIVSAFEDLSDRDSRSYEKRASILETVAKVRSCVVMLDLECDGLIVEMFQHFLNSVRDYHPENVFTSMETIMTLVLEESEDVSLELLTPILASLKKCNEVVPTISQKLGQKVFENCADKIKPYIAQAVKSLGVPLKDYHTVVASICEGGIAAAENNAAVENNADAETNVAVENNAATENNASIDDNAAAENNAAIDNNAAIENSAAIGNNAPIENNAADVSLESAEDKKLASSEEASQLDESKLITASNDDRDQEVTGHAAEEALPEEMHVEGAVSPKSATSNGITKTGNEGTCLQSESLKKPDGTCILSESLKMVDGTKDVDITERMEIDDSDAGKSVEPECNADQTGSSRSKDTKSSSEPHSAEPSDSSHVDEVKEVETSCLKTSEEEAGKSLDRQKSDNQNVDTGASSENEKELAADSSPKALDNEVAAAASSPSKSVADESLSEKAGEQKQDNLGQEDAPSVDPVVAKVDDGTSGSDDEAKGHSVKDIDNSAQDDAPNVDLVSEKGTDVASDSEVKAPRRSGKTKESVRQVATTLDPSQTKVADVTSDSEVKTNRRSAKKSEKLAEAPSSGTVSSPKVDALSSNSAVKAQRRLGKKKDILTQEDAPSAEHIPLKVSDSINDSNIKRQKRSGTKTTARITKEENFVTGGGTSKTVGGDTTSDSEAKPLRQCTKKEEASDLEEKPPRVSGKQAGKSRSRGKPQKQAAGKNEDASDSDAKPLNKSIKREEMKNEEKVSSKKEDVKKRGRGKDTSEKDLVKSPAEDDDQEMISSPKSTSKLAKEEEDPVEVPKTNSKRKRGTGNDKGIPSSSEKVPRNIEYGENLVGSMVKVWWPDDEKFYVGKIASFDPKKKKHTVLYNDGDKEVLALQGEKWKFVDDGTLQEADEDSNHGSSAKTRKSKKAKTNPEPSAKQQKMDSSPNKRAGASSSKVKRKITKNLAKSDVDSDDELLKAANKSDDDDDASMSKTTAKSKEETPKTATKTKSKSSKTGSKSSGTGNKSGGTGSKSGGTGSKSGGTGNKSGGTGKKSGGTVKGKPGTSKVKETTEDTKGKSSESAKTTDKSKARATDTKSGKKRRRGH